MKPSLPSRRQFIRSATAGLIAASSACAGRMGQRRDDGISSYYSRIQSSKYLGKVQIETKLKAAKIFTEGPAVDRAGNVYFTNIPDNKILKWIPSTRKLSTFRADSNATNGLLFEPSGDLLACEGEAGRVTRTNMKTGTIRVVAREYNGFPFASPNDLTLDDEGRIYFSSRPGVNDPTRGNPNAVYRIDPDGKVEQLLRWPDVHMPNGIVTSPDNRKLYLIEAHPKADHKRSILVFDLNKGQLSNQRTLVDFYPGRSGDGMCIDARGNLYVAAGLHNTRSTSETLDTKPGIHVISPQGALLDFVETPEDTVTNCTFGGRDLRTLYVTCGPYLLSIRTRIPGKDAYRPLG